MRLAGKRAVVTGSSSGIGRSIAHALAQEGACVVINARGAEAVQTVVEEIRATGGTASGMPGAVNDVAFAEKLVQHCVDQFGGIDILINNAGVYTAEGAAKCSPETWRETLDINLNAAFYTCHFALTHMMAQRWGRILNAASSNSTGLMGGAAYTASKSALLGFTRGIAADYGRYGITSNVYNPEALTAMGAGENREVFKSLFRWWNAHGYMSVPEMEYKFGVNGPEGVAPWIVYLCLDQAECYNGQVFSIESRRIGMLAWPEEVRTLYRDYNRQGPWLIDELQTMAPLALPGGNHWPRRSDEAIAEWEKQ
jgi:3-oxoacyl-[acyl-carrier protein] reductase